MRVNHGGDKPVIDHRMLTRDLFGDRYAFVTRLMREHRSTHEVSDRVDPGEIRAAPLIHFDKPPGVRLQPHGFRIHGLQRRDPPDRHHQPVKHRFLLFIPGAVTNHDTVRPLFNGLHTAPEVERKAGLLINLKRGARNLLIRDSEETGKRFKHRHFGPQPLPHSADLKPDHAGPDDTEALRNRGLLQTSGRGENRLFIRRNPGKQAGNRTRRHHNVRHRDFGAVRKPDLPGTGLSARKEVRGFREEFDPVFLKEPENAVVRLPDHFGAARLNHIEIKGRRSDIDTEFAECLTRGLVGERGRKHRLGRDAADIRAGAARGRLSIRVLPGIRRRGFKPQLGCADRAFITARPRSDHKDIKINSICHQAPPLKKDPDRILNE